MSRSTFPLRFSPGYLESLGQQLVAGRTFVRADSDAVRTVIVNQAFAREYFGGNSAIGRRIRPIFDAHIEFEIVGVVHDMLLAAIGLYGVMAYVVTRRTREIGMRMALGAKRTRVLSMVMSEVGVVIAAGLCIGVPGALPARRASRINPVRALRYE